MKSADLKLTLKPWVRNLLAIWQDFTDRKIIPSVQIFWTMGNEFLFEEIEKAREVVKSLDEHPIVYYPGIGNIGRAGLDLIYPLAVTDFSKLIAVDRGPYDGEVQNYEKFIQAVALNLSLVSEINQEEISFQMVSENEFKAFFTFEGLKREVHFFANFDATRKYPSMLQDGYQALFTRRTNVLFMKKVANSIPAQLRDEFMNFLVPGGIVIFQEIMGIDENELEFIERIGERKAWLGTNFEHILLGKEDLNVKKCVEQLICFRKRLD